MITESDKKQIIRLYVRGGRTMREIAAMYGASHGVTRRRLLGWGVTPRSKTEAALLMPPVSEETRKKMSQTRKALFVAGMVPYNKGKKATIELRIKNMAGRMYTKLDLSIYSDYERLKFLTYYLSKHRALLGSDDDSRAKFLGKFYGDKQFIAIYRAWIKSGQSKWFRPSLDHKIPRSRGGETTIRNLQFLTWFENRAKAEMTEREWADFQRATKTKSFLFIRRRAGSRA